MTQVERDSLDERYGRRRSRTRRRLALATAALAVLVAVGALVWAALQYASPPVSSRLLGWRAAGDGGGLAVRIEVTVDAGTAASCQVIARAGDQQVVGRLTVAVPTGAQRVELLEPTVATERAATSAELLGCTAPGMPRPR